MALAYTPGVAEPCRAIAAEPELSYMIDTAADSEWVAKKVEDSDGVYLVPAFVGLGAPYWDMNARGTIIGITRGTTKAHIVRATIDSMVKPSCCHSRAW